MDETDVSCRKDFIAVHSEHGGYGSIALCLDKTWGFDAYNDHTMQYVKATWTDEFLTSDPGFAYLVYLKSIAAPIQAYPKLKE